MKYITLVTVTVLHDEQPMNRGSFPGIERCIISNQKGPDRMWCLTTLPFSGN
jgi:hypothetical protein